MKNIGLWIAMLFGVACLAGCSTAGGLPSPPPDLSGTAIDPPASAFVVP